MLRLLLGERGKFQRRGKTDKQTMICSHGWRDYCGDILKQNMGFIPIAISPHGHTSGLFNQHTYARQSHLVLILIRSASTLLRLIVFGCLEQDSLEYSETCWRFVEARTLPRHLVQWLLSCHVPSALVWSWTRFNHILSAIASHLIRAKARCSVFSK